MKLMRLTAAAGALLVLTSCALTTEAITQKPYAPSDGIRVQLDNDVVFENLMIVSDGSGEGVLYGSISNRTFDEVTAEISADGIDESFTLEGRSAINLGTLEDIEKDELLMLEGDFQPGYNMDSTVMAGGAEARAAIPVISACHTDYADAFPGGADCD